MEEIDDDMDDWLKALTPAKLAPFKSKVVITPVVFTDDPSSEDEQMDFETGISLSNEDEVVNLLVDVTSTGSATPSSLIRSEPCSPHVASPLQDVETLRANDAALQQLRADLVTCFFVYYINLFVKYHFFCTHRITVAHIMVTICLIYL